LEVWFEQPEFFAQNRDLLVDPQGLYPDYQESEQLMNKPRVAVVTGGARGIGKAVCEAFASQGVSVCTIDLLDNDYFVGDIADEQVLNAFAAKVISEHGAVDFLVNNACLSRGGLETCTGDDFNYVLKVGITAPFLLTRLFLDHFNSPASIVNISSTRHLMSQADTESYTAAKGGITALTHAMAVTLAGKARVNCISPGWIDTTGAQPDGPDAAQHPVGRVGSVSDIVHAVLFLCDEKSGFITGQNITVDGGMTKLMVYHNDCGWTYHP
jgi:NAD(P)-dependent dehydrogenase (short-subunit alcohol dehydrogenase family)